MKIIVTVLLMIAISGLHSHGVVRPQAETTAPQLVDNLVQFPLSSAAKRVDEGMAEVHFLTDEEGQASEFIVVEATDEDFARSALTGLQQSRFLPAKIDGEPQVMRSSIRLHFRDTGVRYYTGGEWISHRFNPMRGLPKPAFRLCQLNELDEVPQLLAEPKKIFPVDEQENFINGTVRMEYYIDRDGQTRLALPVESAHPSVVEAAILSIQGMRYDIPRKNGRPMPVRVQQTFEFKETDS